MLPPFFQAESALFRYANVWRIRNFLFTHCSRCWRLANNFESWFSTKRKPKKRDLDFRLKYTQYIFYLNVSQSFFGVFFVFVCVCILFMFENITVFRLLKISHFSYSIVIDHINICDVKEPKQKCSQIIGQLFTFFPSRSLMLANTKNGTTSWDEAKFYSFSNENQRENIWLIVFDSDDDDDDENRRCGWRNGASESCCCMKLNWE